MTAPDRPTREQVDAALHRAEQYGGGNPPLTSDVLAAEVRALRAELEQQRRFTEVWRRGHQETSVGTRAEIDRLRAALVARTPQPAEPSVLDRYCVVAFDSPPAWCDEPRTRGLDERWEAAVVELSDSIPDIVRCWRCGAAVGYVVAGESDGLMGWRFAALVSGPGTDAVSVQCEECVPDALPTPWTYQSACPDGCDGPEECSHPRTPGGDCLPCAAKHAKFHDAPLPAVPDGEDVLHDDDVRGARSIAETGTEYFCIPADGEDVPARLDAAAEALEVGMWTGSTANLREVASALRDRATPHDRAAVAAALARPTGGTSL